MSQIPTLVLKPPAPPPLIPALSPRAPKLAIQPSLAITTAATTSTRAFAIGLDNQRKLEQQYQRGRLTYPVQKGQLDPALVVLEPTSLQLYREPSTHAAESASASLADLDLVSSWPLENIRAVSANAGNSVVFVEVLQGGAGTGSATRASTGGSKRRGKNSSSSSSSTGSKGAARSSDLSGSGRHSMQDVVVTALYSTDFRELYALLASALRERQKEAKTETTPLSVPPQGSFPVSFAGSPHTLTVAEDGVRLTPKGEGGAAVVTYPFSRIENFAYSSKQRQFELTIAGATVAAGTAKEKALRETVLVQTDRSGDVYASVTAWASYLAAQRRAAKEKAAVEAAAAAPAKGGTKGTGSGLKTSGKKKKKKKQQQQ